MSSIVLIDTSVFLNVLNGEGTSLSDHSIIKEWEKLCKRHRMSRVLIWSLDADLIAYDRHP